MRARNQRLTAERARELFSYDEKTGLLTRKIKTNRSKAGTVVGSGRTKNARKYMRVMIDGSQYYVHRVIWLMKTGSWPDEVDHINHDSLDNRWENLRNVNRAANARNRRRPKKNKSGILGVYWSENEKKWLSIMRDKDALIMLYKGLDFFEACCQRKSAERIYGYHENHGF